MTPNGSSSFSIQFLHFKIITPTHKNHYQMCKIKVLITEFPAISITIKFFEIKAYYFTIHVHLSPIKRAIITHLNDPRWHTIFHKNKEISVLMALSITFDDNIFLSHNGQIIISFAFIIFHVHKVWLIELWRKEKSFRF